MNEPQRVIMALMAASLAMPTTVCAQDQTKTVAEAARALIAGPANPVVNVGAILQIEADMMGANEEEMDTVGLVVDASGLVAVSSKALNPQGEEPRTFEAGPGMEITISAETAAVWLQLQNGKRVDAEIVLTDPDSDIAFVRPKMRKDSKPLSLPAARLESAAPKAELLDQVIILSRLGKETGWAPHVRLERISAVLDTPWRGYVVDAASPGDAVFTADGRLLGITVVLPSADSAAGMPPMMGAMGSAGRTAVLPVAQLEPLIEQIGRGTAEAASKSSSKPKPKPTGDSDQPTKGQIRKQSATTEAGKRAPAPN